MLQDAAITPLIILRYLFWYQYHFKENFGQTKASYVAGISTTPESMSSHER